MLAGKHGWVNVLLQSIFYCLQCILPQSFQKYSGFLLRCHICSFVGMETDVLEKAYRLQFTKPQENRIIIEK